MSEQETWKGTLKAITIADKDRMEEKCKEICLMHGIKKIEDWCETWEDQLREDLSDRYIVIDHTLYEYLEKTDLQYSSFCNITKIAPLTYEFTASFYNGGTCLGEMLEEALKEYKDEE